MTAELVTSFPGRRIPADAGAEFEAFYARYNPCLIGYAARVFGGTDAEDIAQETMARTFVHFGDLDPARDPWPWLCVVARRVGMDIARLRARTVAVDDSRLAELPAADGETPADRALANDDRRALRRALAELSPNDRRVLRLREFDDLSSSDMAVLLDCSETAVRQQLFRARRRLAERFRALSPLSALPPMLLARSAQRRMSRLANKLAGSTGSVTAGGLAMSAVVVVGGGLSIGLAGATPRTVDLSGSATSMARTSPATLASRSDRLAAATRPAAGSTRQSTRTADLGTAWSAPGDVASATVEGDSPTKAIQPGERTEYTVTIVVLGRKVSETSVGHTNPNEKRTGLFDRHPL